MCICQKCGGREALITVHPEGKSFLYDVCLKCAPRFLPMARVRQIAKEMRPKLVLIRNTSIAAAHKEFAERGPKSMNGPRFGDFFPFGHGGGTGFTHLRKSERFRATA